ncbi:hypothetical protein Plhal703r1_c13g0067571 [Plasmopara halstedii]
MNGRVLPTALAPKCRRYFGVAPSRFSLVPKATLMDQIYSHDVIESVTKQRRDSCTRKHTNLLT